MATDPSQILIFPAISSICLFMHVSCCSWTLLDGILSKMPSLLNIIPSCRYVYFYILMQYISRTQFLTNWCFVLKRQHFSNSKIRLSCLKVILSIRK